MGRQRWDWLGTKSIGMGIPFPRAQRGSLSEHVFRLRRQQTKGGRRRRAGSCTSTCFDLFSHCFTLFHAVLHCSARGFIGKRGTQPGRLTEGDPQSLFTTKCRICIYIYIYMYMYIYIYIYVYIYSNKPTRCPGSFRGQGRLARPLVACWTAKILIGTPILGRP